MKFMQTAPLLGVLLAGSSFISGISGAFGKPVTGAVANRQMTLVDKTRVPEIVIAPDASPSEKFASQELSTYLGKITGQIIKVEETESTPATKQPLIVLGHHPLNANLHPEKLDVEESVIDVTPNRVRIVGGMLPPIVAGKDEQGKDRVFARDRGTLYGVYNFLDGLGVRWYRPESWGEFVPHLSAITLPVARRDDKPVYHYRFGINSYRWYADETMEQRQQAKLWATRNRQNTNMWTPPEYGGYHTVDFGHNYFQLLPVKEYYDKHPEYYALINGKRSNDPNSQLDVGNPEVQDVITQKIIAAAKTNPQQEVFSLEPNDGDLWGSEADSVALDDPNLRAAAGGGVSMSNRVAAFNNIIAKRLATAAPGAKIGWLAYNTHTEVPTRVDHLEPNTIVQAAAYAGAYSDYSKKLRDPSSANNARFLKILEGYGKLTQTMTYEYWSGYAWYGPLPVVHTMADRLREYRKLNVTGVYLEAHPSWGPQGLDLYMYTRLLWNPDLDVQKELDLYYKNYYGPAAVPMKAYHDLIEEKSQQGPIYYSGGDGLEKVFTPELVEQMGKFMAQARVLAKGKAPYEQRLDGVWAGYDVVRRLNGFFALKNAGKLPAAVQSLKDLETFILSYKEGDVFDNGPVIYPSIIHFIRRYDQDIQEQAALMSLFDNPQPVQDLTQSWRFQTDPQDAGQHENWMNAGQDDHTWTLLNGDNTWQDQGYPTYHGVAWYRKNFQAPSHEGAQRIILYFGAVDGNATIYVNGQKVGDHLLNAAGEGWDKPFFFDITDALAAGQPNQIAVRVRKDQYVSGITKGVQLLRVDKVH